MCLEHQSRLKKVACYRTVHSTGVFEYTGKGSFFSLLLGLLSLEECRIISNNIDINTELLPQSNTNLKKLTIQQEHIQPLATLLPNITSLTYLEVIGLVTVSVSLPLYRHFTY